MNTETIVDRETLRAAVADTLTCPRSGQILDVRTAVLVTVHRDVGPPVRMCLHGPAWDAAAEALTLGLARRGHRVEVLDGRELARQ